MGEAEINEVAIRTEEVGIARIRLEDQECTIEDRHPCDISVGVGYLRDTAEAAGVKVAGLDRILAEGYTSEDEIRSAMVETVAVLPDGFKAEGMVAANFVYADLFADHVDRAVPVSAEGSAES